MLQTYTQHTHMHLRVISFSILYTILNNLKQRHSKLLRVIKNCFNQQRSEVTMIATFSGYDKTQH